MTVLPYGLALGVVAGGTALTYLDRGRCPLVVRGAIGACLGFVLLGVFMIPFAGAGVTATAIGLSVAATMAPLLLLFSRRVRTEFLIDAGHTRDDIRHALGASRASIAASAGSVLVAVLLVAVFSGAVSEAAGGIHTHSLANRLDLTLHLGIISEFVWGTGFPPMHPEFAAVPLTYPFIADLGAAVLTRAGASLGHALLLQNVILAVALLIILHYWTLVLTGNRLAAVLTPALVLFGSGLGWLVMLRDEAAAHESPARFLMHLPHSYTLNTANLQWGNLATILLLPQRSLDLGLPLVLVIVTLWWRALRTAAEGSVEHEPCRLMACAGALAGLLPLAHTHSFGVVLLAAAALSLLFWRWRAWSIFFAVTAAIAAPQLFWITRGSPVQLQSFFDWAPGWAKGPEPLAWFWFKNTGLFIPLLLVALIVPSRYVESRLRRFFLPFLLFFIVPNLFRVAPRVWDNNKVLIYWYVAAAPLVALLLARLASRGRVARVAVTAIYLSLIAAGLLDAWRVAAGTVTVTVFDADATDFARLVRSSTPADAVLLRAPTATHPVLLTGRQSVVGYPSRLRLHGLDPSRREADNACVFTGCPAARRVVDTYGPAFLVVGPDERQLYSLDERYLESFPLVGEAGGYQLRRIRHEGTGVTPASVE